MVEDAVLSVMVSMRSELVKPSWDIMSVLIMWKFKCFGGMCLLVCGMILWA